MALLLKTRSSMLHTRMAVPNRVFHGAGLPSMPRFTLAPPPPLLRCGSLNERPAWPGPGGGRRTDASSDEDDVDFQGKLETANAPMLTAIIKGCQDLTTLHQVIRTRKRDLNHVHISAAMSNVAKSKKRNEAALVQQVMADLSVLALGCLDDMGTRHLCSALWALGKVGGPVNPDLVQGLLDRTRQKLPSFNAQDISNTLLAMVDLGLPNDGLGHAILKDATGKLKLFQPQALTNSLWAAAKLGIANKEFTEKWIDVSTPMLTQFKPQELSNSIWAAATLGIDNQEYFKKWMDVATPMLPHFAPQGLSNSLWAAAKLGIDQNDFITNWVAAAKHQLPNFIPLDLVQVSSALAALKRGKGLYGSISIGFQKQLVARVEDQLEFFTRSELNVALEGLQSLGWMTDTLRKTTP